MNTNIATKEFSYTGAGSTEEVVFAQVPLLKSQLEKLKQRSGMITTEDALQTAVNRYLEREEGEGEVVGEERKREKESESERTRAHAEGLVFVSGKAKIKNINQGHWHWNGYGYGHEHEYKHEMNQNWELLAIEMEIMSQVKSIRWLMF